MNRYNGLFVFIRKSQTHRTNTQNMVNRLFQKQGSRKKCTTYATSASQLHLIQMASDICKLLLKQESPNYAFV